MYLAGDGAGIGGADVAELQGERAALAVLEDLGKAIDVRASRRSIASSRVRRAFAAPWKTPIRILRICSMAWPTARSSAAARASPPARCAARRRERGAHEMNRLKAFTRIGMGRCQGRVCGHAAAEILARTLAKDIAAVGRLRGNPPIKPIPIGGLP